MFNLNNAWTEADVAALLASARDNHVHRLVVEKNGDVRLLNLDNETEALDDYHAYFETWGRGTDYVGPGAAADKKHVGWIVEKLLANWPELEADEYIDH